MLLPASIPTVKILTPEPLIKLGEAQSYRIRVVTDKRGATPLHAVAALRCENREEIHFLSTGLTSEAETARLMRSGFIPAIQDVLGFGLVHELLRKGQATLA